MHPSLVPITILVGMMVVFLSEQHFSDKLREGGFVSQDMYKPGKVMLPSKGGLLILFGGLISLIVMIFAFRVANFFMDTRVLPYSLSEIDEAIMYTALIFAFYGVLDDYMNVGRVSKLILPVLFSYPIATTMSLGSSIPIPLLGSLSSSLPLLSLGGESIVVSQAVRFLIVPLYIMVVANLVNMHSGFNGLQSGLSLILLCSLLFKASLSGSIEHVLVAAAVTGGLAGFWWYNKYPARLFEGNTGSMVVGATMGGIIVTQGFFFSGFVMLIPHTVNFLMYFYWRLKRKLLVRQGKEPGYYHHTIKFGELREDGTLDVPNRLTLKWFIPYHRPTTEKQAVLYMYALTAVFCVIGILMPVY